MTFLIVFVDDLSYPYKSAVRVFSVKITRDYNLNLFKVLTITTCKDVNYDVKFSGKNMFSNRFVVRK